MNSQKNPNEQTRCTNRRNRNKAECERRFQETQQELDAVYADFAEAMSKLEGGTVGAVYIRFSTKYQDSSAAQTRELLKAAVAKEIFVPRDLIFLDLAIRGSTTKRAGLKAASDALQERRASVLLVFATNRLHRKTRDALLFMDRATTEWKARLIFLKNGFDTADPQFNGLNYQIMSAVDEFSRTMYAENVRAAHLDLFEQELVSGTVAFGYTGEVVSGRNTRLGRPRRRLVIDNDAAIYVKKIFHWFVKDQLTIEEIVRRLNDEPGIPLPPRSAGTWTRLSVVTVLHNPRYVGKFIYGLREAVDLPGREYVFQQYRDKPLAEKQIERLRIIDSDVWFAAQQRLDDFSERTQRATKGNDGRPRSQILHGLFHCPTHDRPLYHGGAGGRFLHCPCCKRLPAEKRTIFTQLNRDLALERLAESLGNAIVADDTLVPMIVKRCRSLVENLQEPDPTVIAGLRNRDRKLANAIEFAKRNPGETSEEQDETKLLLRKLRVERQQNERKLSLLNSPKGERTCVPSEDEVREMITNTAKELKAAACDPDEEQACRVRRLLRLLTGGRIDLVQRGEKKAQLGWLEGRFRLQLLPLVADSFSTEGDIEDLCGPEITVDFSRPVPPDDEAERAYELDQAGLLQIEIADQLGCCRAKVTNILKHAYAKRGEKKPDGRCRRGELARKNRRPSLRKELSERVMELWSEGLLSVEIASTVGLCKDTITVIVREWHEERSLPVPDGRSRRKQLNRKSRPRDNQ